MDKYELQNHPSVINLAAEQTRLELNDTDFARRVALGCSPSSWGKIKKGTYAGNCDNALAHVLRALVTAEAGEGKEYTVHGETVILDHLQAATDAVSIARISQDEHRLVIICGTPGSGKSKTGSYLADHYAGSLIHARPSWAKSYLQMLGEFGTGLGIGKDWRRAGRAERDIINALTLSPRLIIIDEANHFHADGLNFLKTILNETACCLVLLTLPNHLSKMSSDYREEAPQLLRRAIAIIHIPTITGEEINAIQQSLYPDLEMPANIQPIAGLANSYYRLDTVRRVLNNMDDGLDLTAAVNSVKRECMAIAK
ncbi:MAG: ATP-binding protein [Akkermansia sp.]